MLGSKRKNVKEELQSLTQETARQTQNQAKMQEELKAQKDHIQKQQALLDKLTKRHEAMQSAFDEQITLFKQTNRAAAAEVHNLKTARIELKSSVADTFNQQLTKSLQHIESSLQKDTGRVDELTRQIGSLKDDLQQAKTVIYQFQALAKTIEETDFDLKEQAKALKETDGEKVRLLKRIDELESMIAKFKREPRPAPRRHLPRR